MNYSMGMIDKRRLVFFEAVIIRINNSFVTSSKTSVLIDFSIVIANWVFPHFATMVAVNISRRATSSMGDSCS